MENRDGIIEKIKKKMAERKPYTTKTTSKYTGATTTKTVRPRSEKEKVEQVGGDYTISKKKLNKEGDIKKDVTKYYDEEGNLKGETKLRFKKLKNSNPDGPSMSMKIVKKPKNGKKTVEKTTGYAMPAGSKKMDKYLNKKR